MESLCVRGPLSGRSAVDKNTLRLRYDKVPTMAPRFLIIDGYNLLHDAGLARANYRPGELARQRQELLNKLARRLTLEERQRCTVVFDAIDAPPNLSSRFTHENITIQFAKPGQEADEVIEHLVSQHSAPRRVTVVSSDHRLQNAISRRRGIGIDSDVFLKQLESPHRHVGPAPHHSAPTEIDVNFWIEEFDGISPQSLDAELDAQSGETKSDWARELDQLQERIRNPKELEQWLNQDPKSNSPPRGKPPKA